MIEISFELDGRPIKPGEFGDALERIVIERIEERFRKLLGDIRDPESGRGLKLKLEGQSLDDLTLRIDGPEAAVAEAERRLAQDDGDESE